MFAVNDLRVISDATQAIWESPRTGEACRIELGCMTFRVTYGQFMYRIERVEPTEGGQIIATILVTADLTETERNRMDGKRLTGFAVIDVARDRIVAETDDGEILDALGAGLVAAMVAQP